jgi:hypothetical protein
VNQDAQNAVVESYAPSFDFINRYLLEDAAASAFRAWIRSNFQPMLMKIGWTPGTNENADTHQLRGNLIRIMGVVGDDPETIRQSTRLAEQYLKSPDSVDATMANDVLAVAASHGNEALFDQYVSAMRQMHSPEQYYNLARALAQFRDPKIVVHVLEMAVSDEVRSQDAAGLISAVLSNNQNVAWEWVKANWPAVEKKTTMSSGASIVGATRGFCSAEMHTDVQNFFTEHKVPSAERTLKQSLEDIDACTRRRPKLQAELAEWLQQHPGTSGAEAK